MQIYKRYKKVYVVFLVLCFLAVHRSHAALLNWVVYSEKRKKKKEKRKKKEKKKLELYIQRWNFRTC